MSDSDFREKAQGFSTTGVRSAHRFFPIINKRPVTERSVNHVKATRIGGESSATVYQNVCIDNHKQLLPLKAKQQT